MTEFREIATGLQFPEGPVAMPDGSVLAVEIAAGRLSRVAPDGTVTVVAETGGGPNGAAIGPDGRCYLCNNGGMHFHVRDGMHLPGHAPEDAPTGWIEAVDLQTGAIEILYRECNGQPLRAPNDLVFDADGGMWFTDHGKSREHSRDKGGIYYAKADGSYIKQLVRYMDGPNGIGLSPDGKTLYQGALIVTHRDRVCGPSGRREAAGDVVHRQGVPTPSDGPHTRPKRRLPRAFGQRRARLPMPGIGAAHAPCRKPWEDVSMSHYHRSLVLYAAETPTGRIWAYDVTGPGEISKEPGPAPWTRGRLLANPDGYHLFDSLAVDSGGNICVGSIPGKISVVSPDGKRCEDIAMPDPFPTNICFGGPDLRTAYITLSGAGRLIAMEWPRPGLPLNF